jgi:hypothetical protein
VQWAVVAETTHDGPAGEETTEYDRTGDPPSSTGATHDTSAVASPGTAITAVGGDGNDAAELGFARKEDINVADASTTNAGMKCLRIVTASPCDT